ncbi:MAG: hemerythrin domain-containing protein [bacterium]
MDPRQKFHEHHEELINQFKRLRDSALQFPGDHGDELCEFLSSNIKPHAEAEEAVLYEKIDSIAGDEIATLTMRKEHEVLTGLIDKLQESTDQRERFQETLLRFSNLLLNHFDKEEDVLIPYIVDRRTEKQLEKLLHEVHEEEESNAHA